MIVGRSLCLLSALALAGGCKKESLETPDAPMTGDAHPHSDLRPPADGGTDARTPDAAPDAPLAVDGGADARPPIDAPMVLDATPDNAKPGDLAGKKPDLAGCGGGFINTDASDGCPLVCSPLVENVAPLDYDTDASIYAPHIPYDMGFTYKHNPPCSGPHWGTDRIYGKQDTPIPPEWYVHDLEHGAVVFLYNCPKGCADVVALFYKLYTNFPLDQFGERRILITPYPDLPKKIGAVAWGWSYVSDTLDEPALDCFLHARYGHGLEDFP